MTPNCYLEIVEVRKELRDLYTLIKQLFETYNTNPIQSMKCFATKNGVIKSMEPTDTHIVEIYEDINGIEEELQKVTTQVKKLEDDYNYLKYRLEFMTGQIEGVAEGSRLRLEQIEGRLKTLVIIK